MKEETPKDITPMKRKGIEMSVKGLSKTYPFVKGYMDDTSDQYESAHYVDLLIDLDELANYMGVEVNPYWSNELKNDPRYQKVYAIWSYLKFPPEYDIHSTNIHNHPGYILGQDITHLLNTIYEYLPEQYKLYYNSTSTYFTDNPPVYPVSLKINGYIMR